jgi:hypothetical protein
VVAVHVRARCLQGKLGGAGDTEVTTRRTDGAAPQRYDTRGELTGERAHAEVVGRLGEETLNSRTPSVRHCLGLQSEG